MKSLLSLLLVLLTASYASAGFSFKFEHNLNNVAKGASDSLTLFAAWDGSGTNAIAGFGTVSFSGSPSISFTSGTPQGPNVFAINTSFGIANQFQNIGTVGVQVSSLAGDGDQATLNFAATNLAGFTALGGTSTIVAVPEPTSAALLGLSLAGVMVFRRRRI